MSRIRPQTLALFTLAAIAWEIPTPAQALPMSDRDVIVPVSEVTPAAIAPSTVQSTATQPIPSPDIVIEPEFATSAPTQSQPVMSKSVAQVPDRTPPSASAPWIVPTNVNSGVNSGTVDSTTDSTTPVSVPPLDAPVPAAQLRTPIVEAPDFVVVTRDVQIIGVDAELQQVAFSRIKTRPGGDTSQVQLQQDVQAILETGLFANANVRSQSTRDGLNVTFQLEPMVVRSLRLSGAQVLTMETARELFGPQMGAIARPSTFGEAVKRINQWYAQNGYRLARVLTLDPERDGTVTIDVAEGVIRDVQFRFITKDGRTVDEQGRPIQPRTQERLLRQQVKLQPGQVFQQRAAQEDLQRLAALGVMENLSVSLAGDAQNVTVIYNITEAKSRGINVSGGYNEDLGIFGSFSYQDGNLSGLGQNLSSSVQIGSKDIQFDTRFRSPYRDTDPSTPGYGGELSRRQGMSRVFDDRIKLENGESIRERRQGIGAYVERPIGPDWMGRLGMNYTNISLRDRSGDIVRTDARENPLSFSGKGIDDLTTLSFSAVKDDRDNRLNPSTGSVLSLSTEQSIPIGRGNILSNRLQANYAQYVPVNWLTPSASKVIDPKRQPEVFAFNVQGGTVIGDLPPYNAYTLGGSNSVRGYGTGDVATSRSYVAASAEYRFPVYKIVGGVLFADFATGLGTQSDVLGQPGIQRDQPGSGFGYGAGLRIHSPLGIIRADFGINDQGENRLQFGFGQRF